MDLHEVLAESLFADELHNLVWRLDKPQADPPP